MTLLPRMLLINLAVWGLVALAVLRLADALDPPQTAAALDPAPPQGTPAEAILLEVEGPAPALVKTAAARPLFQPDRRATAAPQAPRAAAAPTAPPPSLRLVGTIVTPSSTVALVQPAQGEVLRLRPGADVEGWQVREITRATLVLEQGRRRHHVDLGAPAQTALAAGPEPGGRATTATGGRGGGSAPPNPFLDAAGMD